MKRSGRPKGFSLTEMAVVLVIVALLIGGLVLPYTAQQDIRYETETKQTLASAQETLLGFAALYGRLPCPASATSIGQEDCAGTSGNGGYYGYLPAAKLGLSPINDLGYALDGWNQPIRYAVTNATIGSTANAFTTANGLKTATLSALSTYLGSSALLSVCTSGSNITSPGTSGAACNSAGKLTDSAVVVIYSTGKNSATGGTGSDERNNPNTNATIANDPAFVYHEPAPSTAAAGEFDDIVVWLSPNSIISKMISAGML